MHLQRNFVWTLDLSDRELKLLVKLLSGDEELTEDETGLADKLAEVLAENAVRLERVSSGRGRKRRSS